LFKMGLKCKHFNKIKKKFKKNFKVASADPACAGRTPKKKLKKKEKKKKKKIDFFFKVALIDPVR
jgi:hypothetical protein